MARNGVAVIVDPCLGKSVAGRHWVPVPAEGVPEWLLEMKQVRQALCAECDMNESRRESIWVKEVSWEGVIAWGQQELENARKEAERVQAGNEYVEQFEREVNAATANPEPSKLLVAEMLAWGYRKWSTSRFIYDRHGCDDAHAARLANCERNLAHEADRRTLAEQERVALDSDSLNDAEFFEKFGVSFARAIGRFDRLQRIEAELAERRHAEHTAAVRGYLMQLQTGSMLERFEAGVLPDEELKQALRILIFTKIDLDRYEKILPNDVTHDDDCDSGGGEIAFSTDSYEGEMTAGQWQSWKHVREVCRANGFEPELRMHLAKCTECNCRVRKLSARITAKVGNLTLRCLLAIADE